MSDIDTAAVDSLKVLDPNRPIREADIRHTGWDVCLVPFATAKRPVIRSPRQRRVGWGPRCSKPPARRPAAPDQTRFTQLQPWRYTCSTSNVAYGLGEECHESFALGIAWSVRFGRRNCVVACGGTPKKERGGSRSSRTNPGWNTEQIILKTPRLHSPARRAEGSSRYGSTRPAKA